MFQAKHINPLLGALANKLGAPPHINYLITVGDLHHPLNQDAIDLSLRIHLIGLSLEWWRLVNVCYTLLDPSCDFEKDLCSWKQEVSDNFDWTRQKGPTGSSGTGPSTDQSGNGKQISLHAYSQTCVYEHLHGML